MRDPGSLALPPSRQRIETLGGASSIPYRHFVATGIRPGRAAADEGSLNLEDSLETQEGRRRLYKNALQKVLLKAYKRFCERAF